MGKIKNTMAGLTAAATLTYGTWYGLAYGLHMDSVERTHYTIRTPTWNEMQGNPEVRIHYDEANEVVREQAETILNDWEKLNLLEKAICLPVKHGAESTLEFYPDSQT